MDASNLSHAILRGRRAVRHFVWHMSAHAAPSAPVVVDIYTRGTAAKNPDAALTVDLTHLFNGRHASIARWTDTILPALRTVLDTLAREAPGRAVQLGGLLGLPTAVALGTNALSPRGGDVAWMQLTPGRELEPYSLAAERKPCGFDIKIRDGQPAARGVAVLVNVTDETVSAFSTPRICQSSGASLKPMSDPPVNRSSWPGFPFIEPP
jgi:hypothetical protein